MIYLDAGATTLQKPPMVAYHMQSALRRMATPGRGAYAPAMRAADAVYDCRVLAAELFGAQPEQVVFTMNATHALNLAIKTLVRPGGRAVISGFEHNAVVRPLHHIGAEMIVAGRRLFDPADTLAAFEAAVTPDTQAVICTHVSNVFGYILPLEEIAALCRARRVPLIVDASQSAGLLPVSLEALGAAFVCMPGHKALYGPQGTGLLLCGRTPDTLLEGGSGSASRLPDMPQELPDHAEAGTQNVCGICGLAAGLRFVRQQGPERLLAHEAGLRAQLAAGLQGLGGVHVYTGEGQSGTLSVRAEAMDCETLAARLAEHGVCTRAGLHCAPLAIGHSFARHKLLWSVVFFFAIQIVIQIIGGVFGLIALPHLWSVNFNFMTAAAAAHAMMWSSILVTAIYGAILYGVTLYMLRKRLNLE